MSNPPRRFRSGNYYHVYNRGNQRSVIFRDADDRRYFLSKLDQFCERDSVLLVAYCLMDNHFHLVLRQDGACPVGHVLQSLLAGYSIRYNHKYGSSGTLFQERFRAKAVGDEHYLATLSRYIHLNPHPFADYRTYKWSSYRQYAGAVGICDPGPVLDLFGGSKTSYTIFMEKAISFKEREKAGSMV